MRRLGLDLPLVSAVLFGQLLAGCSAVPLTRPAGSDAGTGTASDAGGDAGADETTGKRCSSDADCHAQGAPAINKCSNDPSFAQTIGGVPVQLWPTPICLEPLPGNGQGNCDPAPPSDPYGQIIHFCDGPDDVSSPGICVAMNTPRPQSGEGICYPKCTFATDGSAPLGCVGSDACVYDGYAMMGGAVTGLGFCQGECQQDSDCSALGTGSRCQVDLGFCTTSPRSRTKSIGEGCSATDETSGACNCAGASAGGYCTTACTVGGPACPPSWVCDTRQPATLEFGGAVAAVPVTAAPMGMVGTCAPECSIPDSGAQGGATDAASPSDGEIGDATAPSDGEVIDAPVDSASADAGEGEAIDAAADAASADATVGGGDASSGVCPGATACRTGGLAGPACLP